MNWNISESVQDDVIEIAEFDGLPVLIFTDGYPQRNIVDANGELMADQDRIEVQVWGGSESRVSDGQITRSEYWDRVIVTRVSPTNSNGACPTDSKRVLDIKGERATIDEWVSVGRRALPEAAACNPYLERKAREARLLELRQSMPEQFNSLDEYRAYCNDNGVEIMDVKAGQRINWNGRLGEYAPEVLAKFDAARLMIRSLEEQGEVVEANPMVIAGEKMLSGVTEKSTGICSQCGSELIECNHNNLN